MAALEYQRRRLLRGDELPAEFFNRPRDRLAGLGLPGRLETSRSAAPSSSTKHHAVVLVAERKEGKAVPPIRGPGLVDLNKLPCWLPSLLLLRSVANKYSHRAGVVDVANSSVGRPVYYRAHARLTSRPEARRPVWLRVISRVRRLNRSKAFGAIVRLTSGPAVKLSPRNSRSCVRATALFDSLI